MPLKSRAQEKFLWATNPALARRFEDHTPKGTKLPEHVKKTDEKEKRAFATAFIVKCANAGITDPNEVAAVAVAEIEYLRSGATTKRSAYVMDTAGSVLGSAGVLPIVGSIGAPLAIGAGLGTLVGKARNEADTDDAETLRYRAAANAYRRRTALAKTNQQVRQLVASDPKSYVPI